MIWSVASRRCHTQFSGNDGNRIIESLHSDKWPIHQVPTVKWSTVRTIVVNSEINKRFLMGKVERMSQRRYEKLILHKLPTNLPNTLSPRARDSMLRYSIQFGRGLFARSAHIQRFKPKSVDSFIHFDCNLNSNYLTFFIRLYGGVVTRLDRFASLTLSLSCAPTRPNADQTHKIRLIN